MMTEPILIAALPRSGSSLVAKIFDSHGVWSGDCKIKDNYSSEPYPAYENKDIDTWLYQNDTSIKEPFADLMNRINPYNKRWLYKGKPSFIYRVWREVESTCPAIIKVTRNHANIVKSCNGKVNLNYHLRLFSKMKGLEVDSDQIVAGDFSTLEKAFDYCGIAFDREIAKRQIDRRLWHHA